MEQPSANVTADTAGGASVGRRPLLSVVDMDDIELLARSELFSAFDRVALYELVRFGAPD